MTLISQIITEAFRESNNTAIGQTPTSAEQAEAILLFNRFLRSVFGNEAGDPFSEVLIGTNNLSNAIYADLNTVPSNWYPSPNSRLILNLTSAQTIYLNPNPQDGERFAINDASGNFSTYNLTLKGNGRLIEGSNQLVLNTNNLIKEYFYRSDTNNWVPITDLLISDVFPFPEEFEDLFIIGLALRINPRNKQEIDPQSIQTYSRLKTLFRSRYSVKNPQKSEDGLIRTSGVPYTGTTYYSTLTRFNIGL